MISHVFNSSTQRVGHSDLCQLEVSSSLPGKTSWDDMVRTYLKNNFNMVFFVMCLCLYGGACMHLNLHAMRHWRLWSQRYKWLQDTQHRCWESTCILYKSNSSLRFLYLYQFLQNIVLSTQVFLSFVFSYFKSKTYILKLEGFQILKDNIYTIIFFSTQEHFLVHQALNIFFIVVISLKSSRKKIQL